MSIDVSISNKKNTDWELFIKWDHFKMAASTLPSKEWTWGPQSCVYFWQVAMALHPQQTSQTHLYKLFHLIHCFISFTLVTTKRPDSNILRPLIPNTTLYISISLQCLNLPVSLCKSLVSQTSSLNVPLTSFLEQLELKPVSPLRFCFLATCFKWWLLFPIQRIGVFLASSRPFSFLLTKNSHAVKLFCLLLFLVVDVYRASDCSILFLAVNHAVCLC